MSKFKQALLIGVAACAPTSAFAQSTGTLAAESGQEDGTIVVTAQRRDERLVDVPISITVMDGDALDKSSYGSVNDALRSVPGIAVYENGQANMNKLSIRGVTSNGSAFNGSTTVGYYFDEIPFAFVRFPFTPDLKSYDLDQIEVLRGPQGTLYGAGSLNGVIRVGTSDADMRRFEAKGRAMLSTTKFGGENYRGDVAVNIPIVEDKLAVRAVAGYADYGGWIDLPTAGLEDVNSRKSQSYRVKVNATPTESLSIEGLIWFTRDDTGAPSQSISDRTSRARFPERGSQDMDAYNLQLTYSLPGFDILSSTSHASFSSDGLLDLSQVDRLDTRITGRLTSQELRASSTGDGPWRWSIGGIYRNAKDTLYQNFLDDLISPTATGILSQVYTSRSYAAFGELTRTLADGKLELTGGLRYFKDRASSEELSSQNPADILFPKRTSNFDAWTPRAVITYHPNRNSSLYATYSQGFRSGFTQNGIVIRASNGLAPDVRPDRLHNYEVGVKGVALEGKFNYELAAYYINWFDAVQVLQFNSNPGGTPTFVNGAINSSRVNSWGIDALLAARPAPGLEVGGTLSWNNLAFAQDVRAGSAQTLIFPQGARLDGSPELTVGGYLKYRAQLGNDHAIELASSAQYTSKMETNLLAGSATLRNAGEPQFVARASATLRFPSDLGVMLFVDNLTNERDIVRPDARQPGMFGDRIRPRTIGIQVDVGF